MLDIRALLHRLLDSKVEFVIIGGIAGTVHGSARITLDLDICYSRAPESVERLVLALAALKPKLRGVPPGLPFQWDSRTVHAGLNFTLETDLGPIDLLGEVAGIGGYPEALTASEQMPLFGRPCHVLTLDALIQSKRAAGRQRDLEHVIELDALKELRSRKND